MTNEKVKRMLDACYQAKRIRELLPPLPQGVMPSYIQYMDTIQKLEKQGIQVKVSCIDAVNSGEADSTLLSALRVSQLLNGEKKLNIITLSDSEKLCFGVAAGNKALLQILNHGLSILGESYGLNHTYRYLDTVVTYTLTDVI